MYVRTRLTFFFVVILAVVVGAFSLVVFEATRAGVLAEIQDDVRARAKAIAATAPASPNGLTRLLDADVFTTPDTYVQLVDENGQVLERSRNLEDQEMPFLRDSFEAGQVKEVHIGELPVFMFGAPIKQRGELLGYVVVGQSPRPVYQVLRRLRAVLVPLAAFSLATTALVAWLMVRRTMGPLARLANAASRIAKGHDHTGRVGSTDRGDDEIGQLAATIDGMLEALEETHRRVQEASDAQRRFLADVSHELRAPLTITLSSLDLLQKVGADDPKFRDRVVADLRSEIDRMARMITQLLMMARTGKSGAATNRPVLIGEVVAGLCRQRSEGDGRLQLDCRIGDMDNAVVQGNEDYLRQLFLILLDNAFKFTHDGGRVEVLGTVRDDTAEVSVTDTGVGIAADELERIFDRFYRGKNSRPSEGMGLGLSIARHIARQHGGDVQVESKVGEGSRFIVSLPVIK